MPTVALFTGPLDPPLRFHREVVQRLAQRYGMVRVVPGGPRPGKTAASQSIHRATLADLTFGYLPGVIVDLEDLERAGFTPPHEHEAKLKAEGHETLHVVPAEFVQGGATATSTIHKEWTDGPRLWAESRFLVLECNSDKLNPKDLPPKAERLPVPEHLSGNHVRQLAAESQPLDEHLMPLALEYVERWGLYQDVPSPRPAPFRITKAHFDTFVDALNPQAVELEKSAKPYTGAKDCHAVVTLGGDGTLLRAIRQHWRKRLPYFGINGGGQGFLLNGRNWQPFWEQELLCYQLPLLWVDVEYRDGTHTQSLAFNDAWVERATGQTAWVKLTVNGEVKVPKLIGDGALVSTAAGSSSYARAMGASPFPLTADVLVLVGSNVLKPTFWRPAVLPLDSVVELEAVDTEKRPLRAFIDGVEQKNLVKRMTVRVSRTAAVELAFLPEHDPVRKLAFVQFPEA